MPADPLLDAHRALLTAEAHLARGNAAAALAELPRADLASIRTEAQRLQATALAATDPLAAARVLLGLPPSGADLAQAAALQARAGRAADARATEDALLVDFPASPEAQALTASVAPAQVVLRLGARSAERIERLLDAHLNERARDEARALLAHPELGPPAACRARFVEGKALRKLRQYKGALEALPRAIAACTAAARAAADRRTASSDSPRKAPEDTPRADATATLRSAQLLEIQVRAIRGEAKTLRARTEALLAADPTHRFGDDALLLLAQLEERSADTRAAARKTYQRILDTFPTGDQTGAAAWGLAFEAIQREAWAEAEPHLVAAIAATWVEPVDRARARYWLARAHRATKKPDTCARFQEAALADGLGFFTWQVLSELERTDRPCAAALREVLVLATTQPAPELAPRMSRDRPAITDAPAHARARTLAALVPDSARDPGAHRLRDWARDELRTLTAAPEDRVALALAFHEIGAHKDAQDILRSPKTGVLDQPPNATTLEAWSATYSRAFVREIEAAARAEELDPLLLTALSREESTFDPEIVSWAGAVGLAQLMPGTAITAHLAVAKKKLDMARLTEPALNLRLGAWVLDDGLDKFGGLVPLALGAYNGGPGLVLKALPSETTPFDLWSESVSVRETRRYIQRVIGTWGIYRFLYAAPEQRFVELPATIAPRY